MPFPTSQRAASPTGPAAMARSVTPSDAAELPDGMARSLFVSTPGALRVMDASGAVVTLVSGASQYHPIQVRQVLETGTTAGGIVALY